MARALSNPVYIASPEKGVDGRGILARSRAPLPTDGRIGDFFIDKVAKKLYGPKIAAATVEEIWPDNGLIKGDRGWMPALAAEADGSRRIMKVIDWIGGEGTKPTDTGYLGATGIVSDKADAVDYRGVQGPQALIDALDPAPNAPTDDTLTSTAEEGNDNVKRLLVEVFDLGGELVRKSVAHAAASTVRKDIKRIRTQFFAPNYADQSSLVGGAHYRRANAEPEHPAKFRSVDRWTADGESDSSNGGWWVIDEPFIDVTAMGAIGDGTTDDSAAFLAADATGLDIYVPPGTFVVGGITLTGKRMYGPGTLKWIAAAAEPMLTLTGAGCVVEQLTIDGNVAGQATDQIAIVTDEAPKATLRNLQAKNGRYKFLLTDVAASPGMSVSGCRFEDWGTVVNCDVLGLRSPDIQVTGCRFRNIGDGHCIRTGLYVVGDVNVPVGGVISGNLFEDTDHVGVTCELYTQGLTISGNTFVSLEQGVKIEREDFTCTDIAVTGNFFRDIWGTVSNNLNGRRITFTGNICVDCAGTGADMGTESICSNNVFLRCGSVSGSVPSVRVSSTYSDTVISGNRVIDAPWRGIEIGGSNCAANDNRVKNPGDRCIFIAGANASVAKNRTTGGTYGILANSSATGLNLEGNNCSDASVANFSVENTIRLTSTISITNAGYRGATFRATIAGGAITIPRDQVMIVVVDTEASAASDDLDTINGSGGGYVGQMIVLRSANAARVVTVKDSTQLRLAGDFVLNNVNDALTLIWTGSQWYEIARSDNA